MSLAMSNDPLRNRSRKSCSVISVWQYYHKMKAVWYYLWMKDVVIFQDEDEFYLVIVFFFFRKIGQWLRQ